MELINHFIALESYPAENRFYILTSTNCKYTPAPLFLHDVSQYCWLGYCFLLGSMLVVLGKQMVCISSERSPVIELTEGWN